MKKDLKQSLVKGDLYLITNKDIANWELLTMFSEVSVKLCALNSKGYIFERLAENHPVSFQGSYFSGESKRSHLFIDETKLKDFSFRAVSVDDLPLFLGFDTLYDGLERILRQTS